MAEPARLSARAAASAVAFMLVTTDGTQSAGSAGEAAAMASANSKTWWTSIAGYAQCKGKCPTSGMLAHTGGLSGVTVTVNFDGSAAAKWTSSRGRSGTIALFCIN